MSLEFFSENWVNVVKTSSDEKKLLTILFFGLLLHNIYPLLLLTLNLDGWLWSYTFFDVFNTQNIPLYTYVCIYTRIIPQRRLLLASLTNDPDMLGCIHRTYRLISDWSSRNTLTVRFTCSMHSMNRRLQSWRSPWCNCVARDSAVQRLAESS